MPIEIEMTNLNPAPVMESGVQAQSPNAKDNSANAKNGIMGIQDTSYLRTIREVVCKPIDGLASLWSYFSSEINLDSQTQYKLATFRPKYDDSNTLSAITALRKKTMLNQAVVVTFCEKLVSQFPGSHLVQSYLYGNCRVSEPPAVTDDCRQLMIPVVLKGTFRAHIVGIFFDRKENVIKFLDSKGLTTMDHEARGDRLLADPSCGLRGLIQKIIQTYGNEDTIVEENTDKLQHNAHDCGMFVSKFFESCLEGNALNAAEGTDKMRLDMIKTILTPVRPTQAPLLRNVVRI